MDEEKLQEVDLPGILRGSYAGYGILIVSSRAPSGLLVAK